MSIVCDVCYFQEGRGHTCSADYGSTQLKNVRVNGWKHLPESVSFPSMLHCWLAG